MIKGFSKQSSSAIMTFSEQNWKCVHKIESYLPRCWRERSTQRRQPQTHNMSHYLEPSSCWQIDKMLWCKGQRRKYCRQCACLVPQFTYKIYEYARKHFLQLQYVTQLSSKLIKLWKINSNQTNILQVIRVVQRLESVLSIPRETTVCISIHNENHDADHQRNTWPRVKSPRSDI